MWKREGESGLVMKLTLTFKNKENCTTQDIQVNSQQRIIDTLLILQEANLLDGLEAQYIKVKSVRKGMYLDINSTYESEHINTSDILELTGGRQ